jgi:hypothetical protein
MKKNPVTHNSALSNDGQLDTAMLSVIIALVGNS